MLNGSPHEYVSNLLTTSLINLAASPFITDIFILLLFRGGMSVLAWRTQPLGFRSGKWSPAQGWEEAAGHQESSCMHRLSAHGQFRGMCMLRGVGMQTWIL